MVGRRRGDGGGGGRDGDGGDELTRCDAGEGIFQDGFCYSRSVHMRIDRIIRRR